MSSKQEGGKRKGGGRSKAVDTTTTAEESPSEGTAIRKRFSPGNWRDGVIEKVWEKDSTKICKVAYDYAAKGEVNEEELPVDESLDLWINAHKMASMAKTTISSDKSSPSPNGDSAPKLFELKADEKGEPYTLDHFLELLDYTCAANGGVTLEDLEGNRLVKAMSIPTEVYGRMLPKVIHKIMTEHMHLTANDFVVDIGHGIGNSCLQAAYTIGCKTKGIECHKNRNDVAQILALRLEDAAHVHNTRDKMSFQPGSVVLRQGSLEDAKYHQFLTEDVTHIFFDNWNGVFSGERADSPNLERYVAALFAATPEGTIMCTVSPLRSTLGCLPLNEANRVRTTKGLPASVNASYYELEESDLGFLSDVYNFAEGGRNLEIIKLYRYIRTKQDESVASFLCNNPLCSKAKKGEGIAAVEAGASLRTEGVAAAITGCTCGVSERVLRKRKARVP